MFPLTDGPLLKWKKRSKAIVEHINRLLPDGTGDSCLVPEILCMQEVDNFDNFFHGKLKRLGYERVCYKQRTCKNGVKKDGSLVAFRRTRFELIETNHIEFNDIARTAPNCNDEDSAKDYLIRDCVGAICVLRDLVFGGLYVVASVHLYWNPRCNDVKLLQAAMLMQRLNEVAHMHEEIRGVVVCGDFNALMDSSVVRLLTKGFLDRKHPECANLEPHVADYIDRLLSECRTVDKFKSSYSLHHPHVSTVTHKFNGLLDYIFYKEMCDGYDSGTCSAVAATLDLPCVKECRKARVLALPSKECPSDHLPIAAVLNFGE